MASRGFRAPHISRHEIQARADEFRTTYWPGEGLPVGIEQIVECDLGIKIIPVSGLRRDSDTDALLLGDMKSIVVDLGMYMDDRMERRMRYSFAHEVGHFVLHRNLFRNSSTGPSLRGCASIAQSQMTNTHGSNNMQMSSLGGFSFHLML